MAIIADLPPKINQLFQNYLNAKAKYRMHLGTYDDLIAYNEYLEAF